jgi:hypothetical protein
MVGTSEKIFGTSEQQTAEAKQLQVTSLGVWIKVLERWIMST